jgi:thioredoxin 2
MSGIRHIVCPACAARNRVPLSRPAEEARCGACKAPLFTGHPVSVDPGRFEKHIAGDDIPVLVDVWAAWCGPCRAMAPMFERVAAMLEPEMRLLKLDADQAPELVGRMGVQGIPALLLFRNGQIVARTVGAMDSARIAAWARAHLAGA